MEYKEYVLMNEIEQSHWWFKGKRRIIFSQLGKFLVNKKNLRILDVGCGTGIIIKNFQKYGEVVGIDIESIALRFCLKRGIKNLACASVANLPFKSNSFDVVGVFDVLYHKEVKNDVAAMKELFRVLNPKGILILTDSADMKLWSRHDAAAHARERYTIPKMSSRLCSAGFKIEKTTYFNTLLYPVIMIVRKIDNALNKKSHVKSNIKKTNVLLNKILYFIFVLESYLINFFNLPFGVSILVIARK